jgi:predicted cupin superfamily sugar epimerase
MTKLSAQQIIDILKLQPHPEEGGYFIETHRSDEIHLKSTLPTRYGGDRCHSTAIYYMLTPQTYSHMHKLETDEIFHFYAGDPCEMLLLHPDGTSDIILLGNNLAAGQRPQIVVPCGSWQGTRLLPGGDFALMGCTVSPGFEFADYSHAKREALIEQYSEHKERIIRLTNE